MEVDSFHVKVWIECGERETKERGWMYGVRRRRARWSREGGERETESREREREDGEREDGERSCRAN